MHPALDHDLRFEDAQRVVLRSGDGRTVTLVVLAVLEIEGVDYALTVREGDAGREDGLCAFTYRMDEQNEPALGTIEDDDTYDEVVHQFAAVFLDDDVEPG